MKYRYVWHTKYALHVPWPHTWRCDDCDALHIGWTERGIIPVGKYRTRELAWFTPKVWSKKMTHEVARKLMMDASIPSPYALVTEGREKNG